MGLNFRVRTNINEQFTSSPYEYGGMNRVQRREYMVTMGSSVIGREGSRGCKLIGWPGPPQAQASQSAM